MTTILIGISVGLGALVVLLLALLVVRWRSDNSTDERVAEVVASLNARMDELGRELAGALERAEEEGRRSRIFGELAGSIDLDEVLSRTLEAAGALEDADAALVMLPDPTGGKPLVATLGLSVEEAERHAITGPPDGRLARSITMSYTYPELEREGNPGEEVINAGLAVPLPGDNSTLGYLTVFTRKRGHEFADGDVRQLETLALRAGPAIENARRFREARQLADLDALTGLHNRRYFHETLARECARAHRYEQMLNDGLRSTENAPVSIEQQRWMAYALWAYGRSNVPSRAVAPHRSTLPHALSGFPPPLSRFPSFLFFLLLMAAGGAR